jgi:2-polyprenyl-3-methyl-5-hydroxy-6-metoxy-1,4-benzoquinol methylase
LKQLIFHIKSHPALDYDDNHVIVNQFIVKRIEYFFPGSNVIFDSLEEIIGEGKGIRTIIIELSSVNPFFDPELITDQIKLLTDNPEFEIRSKGHVPGSETGRVYYLSSSRKGIKYINSNKQLLFNSQLNLNKLKRQKHFKHFLNTQEKFHEYTLESFFDYIESDKGIDDYLKFGENVQLIAWETCPYCSSSDFKNLYSNSSQPGNGFITKNISVYRECSDCGLIFLSKTVKKDEVHKIYDGYMQEFGLHRILNKSTHLIDDLHMYSKALDFLEPRSTLNNIVDLGCGGGEFLLYAKNRLEDKDFTGLDYAILDGDQEQLERAGIKTITGNLIDAIDRIEGEVELFTCWEVVEHLYVDDLKRLFSKITAKLCADGFFCLSTPDYDNEICRLFDFGLATPIQHLTVLSESWLTQMVEQSGLRIVHKFHGNQMLIDESWASYCAETSPTFEGRNISKIFTKLLKNPDTRGRFLSVMEENNLGSEIILVLQK